MTVIVHLFARARELAGTDHARLELAAGTTVGELRCELVKKYPALAGLIRHAALAVAEEFAKDDVVIGEGVEVALLPPVSGG